MTEIFGVPTQALFGQLLLGLINGSFYAMLSLGLAVIFGMLNIINFSHGAQYMMGAFGAYLVGQALGLGYWPSLILAPLLVGLIGVVIERTMLKRLYHLDHLYGLLLTFGVALVIQGFFRWMYGSSGLPYSIPPSLSGGTRLELFGQPIMFLPWYRAWVIVASLAVCLTTWFLIEKTSLGARLRASTENPMIVRTFGINVPVLITLTYGAGVALAGLAGVMAAPIYQVSPLMGADLINVVFAVVVIGGMGSILGSIVTGFALGLVEGLTKVFYPEASTTVVFIIMALVLLFRPSGLFGKAASSTVGVESTAAGSGLDGGRGLIIAMGCLFAALAIAPFILYTQFLMQALCVAIFALSVNLLIGYAGLLSFGHAMFLGTAGYVSAHMAKHGTIKLPFLKLIDFGPQSPEIAILCGTLAALALGAVVGVIAIRRQGIYFAMTTLAFAQMIYFVAVQVPFTGGEDGIQAVPRGTLFGLFDLSNQTTMYYVVLAIFVFAVLLVHRIIHSPFGEVLKSIRENEPRAISLGYKTERYKLIAFILSAGICGLGGATKALVFKLATLHDVAASTSGEVVLMVLIGGLGTVLGPILGAFVIVAMDTYLAWIGQWVTVIQGLVFIVCVLAFRRGLLGEIAHRTRTPL